MKKSLGQKDPFEAMADYLRETPTAKAIERSIRPGRMALVWLRLGLLFLVVVSLGSLILVTTVLRGVTKLGRGRKEAE